MEARYTVMTRNQLAKLNSRMPPTAKYEEVFEAIAKRQAEISYKAGQKEEEKEWIKACLLAGMLVSKPEQLTEIHRVGMEEVVKWVESHRGIPKQVKHPDTRNTRMYFTFESAAWQAFLRKHGIEVEK